MGMRATQLLALVVWTKWGAKACGLFFYPQRTASLPHLSLPLAPSCLIAKLAKQSQLDPLWKKACSAPLVSVSPKEAPFSEWMSIFWPMDAAKAAEVPHCLGSVQNRGKVDTFCRIYNRYWCITRTKRSSTQVFFKVFHSLTHKLQSQQKIYIL